MQVKFGEFNDMQNNRKQNQGKPSRQRKQETAFRALRREARENKRYQGVNYDNYF